MNVVCTCDSVVRSFYQTHWIRGLFTAYFMSCKWNRQLWLNFCHVCRECAVSCCFGKKAGNLTFLSRKRKFLFWGTKRLPAFADNMGENDFLDNWGTSKFQFLQFEVEDKLDQIIADQTRLQFHAVYVTLENTKNAIFFFSKKSLRAKKLVTVCNNADIEALPLLLEAPKVYKSIIGAALFEQPPISPNLIITRNNFGRVKIDASTSRIVADFWHKSNLRHKDCYYV